MPNRTTNILAVILLSIMFILAVASMAGDSLTMDELAHLPAGYSYLTQKDMRLNPEHPPLIKDLAAFPLLFIKGINFPADIKAWQEDVNGQWDFGNKFLFHSNNPADKMIFWGRIPMILILMALGFYIFRWTKELFGNNAALISLSLFSFSPTFLAHGRLVTTDVGAAAGAFIATYYFIKFLKNSSRKNLFLAGVFLGLAELAKFSLILLFPFFGLIILVWCVIKSSGFKHFLQKLLKYVLSFIGILAVCFLLIWAVYQYHTWNYPAERQARDTQFVLSSFGSRAIANSVVWMADKPILRPAAQYLFGVCMVLQRTSGGNTGYFMGEISAAGWKTYFPTVYAIKEPLPFFILAFTALIFCIWQIKNFWEKPIKRSLSWLRNHFVEFSMLVFMAIYWITSLRSNLNIGVRHLLPTFPFAILLTGGVIGILLKRKSGLKTKLTVLFLLLAWQIVSVVSVYPHFLAYFNDLVGGPTNGYLYVTDSNLDWGQDLKRLENWADQNNVDKIYIDYFGGADAQYYLEQKYSPWWGDRDPRELPSNSYLAISATLLQGGRGKPVPSFDSPTGYYNWLNQYEPVTRIGYSIFVYRIP